VNPGEVHDGRAIGRRPRAWRILYLDPALMDAACADVHDGRATPFAFAAPAFLDPRVRTRFDAAFAHATAPAARRDALACEGALLTLVARLLAHATVPTVSDAGPTARVRRARDRIDADPAAPVTLAELAAEAGLSRWQLLRGFARELGLTPHAYVVQRRLALARRLIRTRRSLAEVAVVAGFYDQSHLTRCFVRQFGVTPRRYASRDGGDARRPPPGAPHFSPRRAPARGGRFAADPTARSATAMPTVRPCRDDELPTVLAIVNAAAEAYRGVIPADRWHEPYMPMAELRHEIASGVDFWGYEDDGGALVGVMGIQPVRDVDLIRHAYVLPARQGEGIGGVLLGHLRGRSGRPLLVGTWAAAAWAIRFYERHGFARVPPARAAELLRSYWSVPERQIETSVVLASPPLVA
jgi:AraC-like DNA-binding protein/GNAT superfamily N-acetyltransferase